VPGNHCSFSLFSFHPRPHLPQRQENAANLEIELAFLKTSGKLLTEETYANLSPQDVKKVDWHPFPWALSGQGVLSANPGVRDVVLRQCTALDNLLKELAPLHHADMAKASEAVEIVVPPSMLDAVRDQLGADHERHLVPVEGDIHCLDVRLCAGAVVDRGDLEVLESVEGDPGDAIGSEAPGVLCNGTVNWTRLIAKFLIDLDPTTLSTEVHGDGQDFKAFGKFAVGGASITSPFFSSEKLTAGNFVGYLDSVTLSEKHTVPSGHTAAGTLYALAHEVLTALLADGVDVASLTAEELEALVRGSLIFQATRIHSNALFLSLSLCSLSQSLSSSPFPLPQPLRVDRIDTT